MKAKFKMLKLSSRVTIQTNSIEQYFPMVLFVMLHKVVFTLDGLKMKSRSATVQ